MMINKKQILTVATVLGALGVQAQAISPSTLNASGGSKEIAGSVYEYSIGEMVLVHTASSTNLIVTQGLLQPMEESVGIAEMILPDNALTVYPNPSQDILYIQPNLSGSGTLTLILSDITGREMKQQSVAIQTGNEKQSLNLQAFASGSYLLNVIFDQNDQKFIKSFKVQKVN